jgi:DNA-binding beta-propeller fold protein YncE
MAFSADNDLYVANAHGNTVVRFAALGAGRTEIFPTALNPVALGIWSDDLFVVCQGSRLLLRMDRFTGEVVDLLRIPSEPQDLVINQATGRGFVSSAGEDVVVEIDLASLAQVHRYSVPSKRPRHLFLDADGSVFVAPSLSGNNSTVLGPLGAASVIDLDDTGLFPQGGLPDRDLFRIDPSAQTILPVLRGMGTLLFGHGRNPLTQEYWILNVNARNKNPSNQSESSVNGSFAHNRLSIAALPPTGVGAPLPEDLINLDDSDPMQPGVQVADPRDSMAMPQALAIASSGFGFAASSGNDVVTMLDPDGARLFNFRLPQGSIPLGVALDQTETLLCVFCWGSNQVLVYSLMPFNNTTPIATLGVGLDPTPPSIAAGRRIFYDAAFSRDNRFTCGGCHPGGLTDGIAWNISDTPRDDKGPMVTQPLTGLAGIFPYHWRGGGGGAGV